MTVSRRLSELVAANAVGYISVLIAAGATRDEIRSIRAADRAAQGITSEEEREAERAVAAREELADGRLTVVRLGHARAAAVVDRLHSALGGPGFDTLLVVPPTEINVYGSGEVVRSLDARFPGGWCGGDLPTAGFWGHSGELQGLIGFLVALVTRRT